MIFSIFQYRIQDFFFEFFVTFCFLSFFINFNYYQMIPSILNNSGNSQTQIIKKNISDLQSIDERIKHGILSIKQRLKAATNANCSACPLLQAQVTRKEQQSKEKEKKILRLNLKIDRISHHHNHFSGAHSSRKADLQSKRQTLIRNANVLLSERKTPIQEIYRIQERLSLQMEELRTIEQRTQLLRSKEKRQREVIKRLSSINKQQNHFEFSPSRHSDSKNEEEETKIYRQDDTLRNFKERLACLSPYIEDENTSEFERASLTAINDKCNNINMLISDLKNSNQTLIGRNSFLEREVNKLKEQTITKDQQLIRLNEQKLTLEKQMMNKMADLRQAVQNLQKQHQGCQRSIEYYQNKSVNLEENLLTERHKYQQQLSTQNQQLMVLQGKFSQLEGAKAEKDELKVQVKEQVMRRLSLIEQINLLNNQNYALKITNNSLKQKTEDSAQENSQLKQLLNDRIEEIKIQRNQHTAKMMESEQMRNNLEIFCQKLKQQNQQLKIAKDTLSEEIKEAERHQTIRFLQQKIKKIQNQLSICQNTIDQKEKIICELKWQVNKLNKTIEQQANSHKTSQSERNVYRLEICILTRKCADLNSELDQLKNATQRQIKIYSEQLQLAAVNLETIKTESIKKDGQLKALMSQKIQLNQQIQKLKKQLQQLNKYYEQNVQKQHQQIDKEIDELKDQNNKFKKQNQLLQEKLIKVREDSQGKKTQSERVIEQLTNNIKSNEAQISELNDELSVLISNKQQQQQSIQDLRGKLIIAQKQVLQAIIQNQNLNISILKIQKTNQQLKAIVEASILQNKSSEEKISSLQETMQLISTSHQNQLKFFTIKSQAQQRQINNLKSMLQQKANELKEKQLGIKRKQQIQVDLNQKIQNLIINNKELILKLTLSETKVQQALKLNQTGQPNLQQVNQNLNNQKLKLQTLTKQVQQLKSAIKQHQQRLQISQRQHILAIQMLQQQILERQVEIEHKDNKYLAQITDKSRRVQLLEKQLQETKRVLQEQVVERQTYITLKQSQLDRISSNLKKQIQVLKRDSDEAKRILQVQLIQRQTQISEKDLKIMGMQSKYAQDLQASKRQNEEVKRLLQQQIVERQAQISDKDLKMRQMELSHEGELNKIVTNYQEEKRLLQQQMIQRQAAIVQYDLKLNETIFTHSKQKQRIAQQLQNLTKQAQEKQQHLQKTIQQLRKKILQLADQDTKTKQKIKDTNTIILDLQQQIQRLRKSSQNAQKQSSQYFQKVKILEQMLVEKQNMLLESLTENQANLSLALESVYLKQPSQIEHQKQYLLINQKSSEMEVQTTLIDQCQQQQQLQDTYKLRCQQLESNINNINRSYQQSLQQIHRIIKEKSELSAKLEQSRAQWNNLQLKAAANQKKYQQTQSELLELQGIFINHKISLQELKLQNKTLKERLEQYQKQASDSNNHKRDVIIDESEELIQEMIEEVLKRYHNQFQIQSRKIDQCNIRLQTILSKITKKQPFLSKGRRQFQNLKAICQSKLEQFQKALMQIKGLKDQTSHLHNELTLAQLTSGEIIFQKDELISQLQEEMNALKAQLQKMDHQASKRASKLNIKSVTSFKIEEGNQTHEKDLLGQGSLINPLKEIEDSPEEQVKEELTLLDLPIMEIESEDGQALLTEIKPKSGSEKKMSLLLVSNISEALSESEKNDEMLEMLSSSAPDKQKSQPSESGKFMASSLSLRSVQSAKQRQKQYNQRMKNSVMMAKLRKKK